MTYRMGRFAATALLLLGGCTVNSNSDKTRGGVGESCQARDDCNEGLVCLSAICMTSGSQVPTTDGGVVAHLSQAGESCTARTDCEPGLVCMNQICINPQTSTTDASVVQPVAVGQRGESCRTHGDCATGLACVDFACTLGQLNLVPTNKECVAIQCRTAADCCVQNSSCKATQQECLLGDADACDFYKATCECTAASAEQYDCVDYACKAKRACQADAGTYYSGCSTQEVCDPASSKCVECTKNADCTRRSNCIGKACTCAAQKCVPSCTSDLDCSGLQTCKDSQCVKAPCATDRECIALSGNVLSTCVSGECKLPCKTDAECNGGTLGEGTGSRFRVCVSGSCSDIGCETKAECRVLLHPSSSSNYIDVDCVPKKP